MKDIIIEIEKINEVKYYKTSDLLEYHTLRNFIEKNNIDDDYNVIISLDNDTYVFPGELTPFYIENNKIVKGITYGDIPFDEYERYGIIDILFTKNGIGGPGDLIVSLEDIINFLNEFSRKNPCLSKSIEFLIIPGVKRLLKAFVDRVGDKDENIKSIIDYIKREKNYIEAEMLEDHHLKYTDKEKDEINAGLLGLKMYGYNLDYIYTDESKTKTIKEKIINEFVASEDETHILSLNKYINGRLYDAIKFCISNDDNDELLFLYDVKEKETIQDIIVDINDKKDNYQIITNRKCVLNVYLICSCENINEIADYLASKSLFDYHLFDIYGNETIIALG